MRTLFDLPVSEYCHSGESLIIPFPVQNEWIHALPDSLQSTSNLSTPSQNRCSSRPERFSSSMGWVAYLCLIGSR